ncbi:hypothetical protein Bca52824_052246 [Brassica carinata]|uniref:Uncharacterized protein n=1 Tax=Brassica carinata TaxID=52824 RepID=A0A8X7UKL6_BRACI|nr:hypothetical protein Bca52824_052246 [Brassica carinata]
MMRMMIGITPLLEAFIMVERERLDSWWEFTSVSSSEPSKASKVMLLAHNSYFLLCCGEYFTTMSSFYEWCNRDSLMTAPLSDVSSSLVPLSADDATLAAQTHVLPLANPLAHRSELSASAVASRPTGSSHPFTIQNLHRHRVVCPHFPMTLEVFVVSLDGLSFTIAGSSVTSPIPLSTIYVNPATDVAPSFPSPMSGLLCPSDRLSACHCGSLHPRETFSDQFEPATLDVILPPFPALTTQPLQLKLTCYPRRAPSLMDLNSRPPPEPPDPPDPPDQATPSKSKTFTVIVPFVLQLELVLVDSKNLLVLSVSHSSLVHVCDVVNFLVSTILKSRTPKGFVVSLDGLSFTRTGSSVTSPVPLSTISVNPATDVGETPVRRPDMFLERLRRQSSSSDISLPSSMISISHVWPPPPFTSFKRGGNPLRRQALSNQKLCHCGSLHPRDTFSDQFESATLVVILPPYPALTTQSLQLKLTFYPWRAPSPLDMNSRPPPETPDPPDPPDRATPSQSKTFTVIMPFVL